MPRLTAAQQQQFAALVADYISAQRDKYQPRAVPLTDAEKQPLRAFFTPELLESVRVLQLRRGETIANPDFYPQLEALGFTNLPDQRHMAGITFNDVVVLAGAPSFAHFEGWERLLFHEFVHVEQYRQLGIARFAELYVRGFLTGGSYEAIPLEKNAYGLEARFAKHPERVFSVADELRRWLEKDQF
jgi:hypothetical protein